MSDSTEIAPVQTFFSRAFCMCMANCTSALLLKNQRHQVAFPGVLLRVSLINIPGVIISCSPLTSNKVWIVSEPDCRRVKGIKVDRWVISTWVRIFPALFVAVVEHVSVICTCVCVCQLIVKSQKTNGSRPYNHRVSESPTFSHRFTTKF